MHQTARADATVAFAEVIGAPPTLNELRFLLAEGLFDSTFGAGWHDDGVGSFNMGAIHADPSWKGETFSYVDSHANGTFYEQKFRKYPDAQAGWRDLVKEYYVRRPSLRTAAKTGSAKLVATEMVRTGYAEGYGATEADRVEGWRKALQSSLDEIDSQAPHSIEPVNIRVRNPQGDNIGTTTISDEQAPGLSPLMAIYGAPFMIAYPNGWRLLQFATDVQIATRTNYPYTPTEQTKPLSMGIASGAAIGIMGVAVTILVATLRIQPGRRQAA